jgi:hypothetical protein
MKGTIVCKIRSVALVLAYVGVSFWAGRILADAPIAGTFHVVCGAAPKDGTLTAVVGAPVVFEADAGGVGYTFSWSFSDGSTDTGHQVTHAFANGGAQTASLTVQVPGSGSTGSSLPIQVVGLGEEPNAIIVAGAGFTGSWDTELVLGNPFDSELAVSLFIRRLSSEFGGCMLSTCPPPQPAFITLAPTSEQTVRYSDLFPPGITGVYVSGSPGDPLARLPMVRARAYAIDQPARAMELPTVTYETLVSLPASPLIFLGAARSPGSHSNLFLAETSNLAESDAVVRVDAIDTSGGVVGSLNQAIPAGGAVTFSEVLGTMGITQFDGTLRVTRIGGTGVVNGALATLSDDGGFAVSAGLIP